MYFPKTVMAKGYMVADTSISRLEPFRSDLSIFSLDKQKNKIRGKCRNIARLKLN